MIVTQAVKGDLSVIFNLFEAAIAFQKKNNYIGWSNYDQEFLKNDIDNGLLYKITKNDIIVCIFSICYQDPLIWQEKEKNDAIYLHRIVLNRDFAGEKLFVNVMDWAKDHAKQNARKYIRMDTWADNAKIIDYYINNGFNFIENYTTANSSKLPAQHRNLKVALLEYKIIY